MAILHPDTLAALQAGGYHIVTLLHMEFTPDVYLASSDPDITYGGNTYAGSGLILGVGSVSEQSELRAETLSVEFSGADQTITALVLNNDYIDVPVTYSKAICDSRYQVIGEPIIFYKGSINGPGGSEDGDESVVTLEFADHWANFEAVNGRRANPNSQTIHFPNDLGFEFTGESLQGVRRWGSKG